MLHARGLSEKQGVFNMRCKHLVETFEELSRDTSGPCPSVPQHAIGSKLLCRWRYGSPCWRIPERRCNDEGKRVGPRCRIAVRYYHTILGMVVNNDKWFECNCSRYVCQQFTGSFHGIVVVHDYRTYLDGDVILNQVRVWAVYSNNICVGFQRTRKFGEMFSPPISKIAIYVFIDTIVNTRWSRGHIVETIWTICDPVKYCLDELNV